MEKGKTYLVTADQYTRHPTIRKVYVHEVTKKCYQLEYNNSGSKTWEMKCYWDSHYKILEVIK